MDSTRKDSVMEPNVSFNDQRAIDMTEDDNTPVVEADLTKLERAAVNEVANYTGVVWVVVRGRDHEGFLVLSFVAEDPDTMPYSYLYVDKRGRVAEAMLNQPIYHRTFREMVEDTRSARA